MDVIAVHDHEANQYDRQAKEWGWNPDVFLGLMWEYAQPGDRLLDAGIGTGLCSEPFLKAGLEISGFDGSENMLCLCRAKHISDDLRVHRLENAPWPYPDACFDHVITGGSLHFFGDLSTIFKEVDRVLARPRVFAFNITQPTQADLMREGVPIDKPYAKVLDGASGVSIYKHSEAYILSLLAELGMTMEKQLTFLASRNPTTFEEHHTTLFLAR